MNSEADGFTIEAAQQFGARPANDDCSLYIMTEAQLLAFAKSCERKGLAEAYLIEREYIKEEIDKIDAELAPILAAEQERFMTAQGHVRGTGEPGQPRWIKP
jgi:hypothetical protein